MNKLSLSIKFSLIFLLGLASCDDSTSRSIDGTWKIVKEEQLSIDLNGTEYWQVERDSNIFDHFTFYSDTLMYSHFPIHADYFSKYQIVDEEEILYQNYFSGPQLSSMRFSGDTLILKSRRAKHYEDLYLIKQEVNQDQVALLISDKVDWTFFEKKWQFEKVGYGHYSKHDLGECPDELDLTAQNSSNFKFEKDILNYTENDSLIQFSFNNVSYDNKIIYLDHVCDIKDCKYTTITYREK